MNEELDRCVNCKYYKDGFCMNHIDPIRVDELDGCSDYEESEAE